jgi:uncharacterized protein (TIGR03067 family)
MVVEGEKFTVKGKMGDFKGTIKLDSAKKPKQIDFTFTEGPFTGKSLGIYSLEGEELKMSLGMPGGDERPKDLNSKEGSNHIYIVMKRDSK